MTDDEVEIVAAELAKAGGVAWYFDPNRSAPLRVVTRRYRERARLAIQALERYRARTQEAHVRDLRKLGNPKEDAPETTDPQGTPFQVGDMVIYRPPGDRRSYTCQIDDVKDDEVHLVPIKQAGSGWVKLSNLSSSVAENVMEQGSSKQGMS